MKICPYLSFDGRCREALEFYERTLDATPTFIQTVGASPLASQLPPEAHRRIMHATLAVGDHVLQGADAVPGEYERPRGFHVALHCDDAARGRLLFDALRVDGKVQLDYQATYWARGFGMLVDRFGVPWMINAGMAPGTLR